MKRKKEGGRQKPPIKKARRISKDVSYNIQQKIFSQQTQESLKELKNILLNNKYIFQEQLFLDEKRYDKNRKQINFEGIIGGIRGRNNKEKVRVILQNVRLEMIKHIKNYYEGYELSVGNILMSEPSVQPQGWHSDYDERIKFSHPPLVFFAAVSECRLDIFKPIDLDVGNRGYGRQEDLHKQTKPLKRGDLLTLNGFTIHRGCRYSKTNFRLHWYALHRDDSDKLKDVGDYTTHINITEYLKEFSQNK